MIWGPKAVKPRENQPIAAIHNKIKPKTAAAMLKRDVAQNIANYRLIFKPYSA